MAGRNIYEVYYNFIRPASCASVNYFYEVNDSKNSQLHYEDKLVDTGEPFALRVIESEKDISGELSFDKAGLSVIFTAAHKPYTQRKVRILNSAHTSFVLASYLAENDYIGESLKTLYKTSKKRYNRNMKAIQEINRIKRAS